MVMFIEQQCDAENVWFLDFKPLVAFLNIETKFGMMDMTSDKIEV